MFSQKLLFLKVLIKPYIQLIERTNYEIRCLSFPLGLKQTKLKAIKIFFAVEGSVESNEILFSNIICLLLTFQLSAILR
jgi:hypothetical protein